ncbi:MAG: hypothetical protein BA865_03120 [Desulfobacterales bacterium S5133MH4]|nr:MAG: hypothetical protein BA865_03120 [Desulfobacterales bacterium S5133MH4]
MKRKHYGFLAFSLMMLSLIAVGLDAFQNMESLGNALHALPPRAIPDVPMPPRSVMKEMAKLDSRLPGLANPPASDISQVNLALFGYKAMDMYAEAERIDLLPSDMNYSVSLAFSAEEKGFCIIDGLFYQQGAFLPDDAQIVAIEPRRVMVMKDNLQQWISVEKR